ncbi:MAG TPA: type II toxin-antitoxin system YafQ family toxin [Rikenellaceae bacterium]|nr:type II toxin-antitoxin system YafQ family toxin [Rikenellaceae bacterium]
MKTIVTTRQFRKDIKKYLGQPEKVKKLYDVVNLLQSDSALPQKYKPHILAGEYSGFMECHVESDLLLIWYDKQENTVKLVRFGTHSELFG